MVGMVPTITSMWHFIVIAVHPTRLITKRSTFGPFQTRSHSHSRRHHSNLIPILFQSYSDLIPILFRSYPYLQGLNLEVVERPQEADFLLAHGTEAMGMIGGAPPRAAGMEEMKDVLRQCAQLPQPPPLIVANPDVVTVEARALRSMPGQRWEKGTDWIPAHVGMFLAQVCLYGGGKGCGKRMLC